MARLLGKETDPHLLKICSQVVYNLYQSIQQSKRSLLIVGSYTFIDIYTFKYTPIDSLAIPRGYTV